MQVLKSHWGQCGIFATLLGCGWFRLHSASHDATRRSPHACVNYVWMQRTHACTYHRLPPFWKMATSRMERWQRVNMQLGSSWYFSPRIEIKTNLTRSSLRERPGVNEVFFYITSSNKAKQHCFIRKNKKVNVGILSLSNSVVKR